MNDSLGDRMKSHYEDRWRLQLPRRTYTVLRVDGRAFHTYAASADKPFDFSLMDAMDHAARALAAEVGGTQFGYIQSDECSLLVTDFARIGTDAWFDGNVQKIVSVAAATMSIAFMDTRFAQRQWDRPTFDARVFVIPDSVEVANYFIWRQKDWLRNSLQMVARSHYSHAQLHGKASAELHELIHQAGDNWATYSDSCKNGRALVRTEQGWSCTAAPIWTQDRAALTNLIPTPGYDVP